MSGEELRPSDHPPSPDRDNPEATYFPPATPDPPPRAPKPPVQANPEFEPRRPETHRVRRVSAFFLIGLGAVLGGTCVTCGMQQMDDVVPGPGESRVGVVEVLGAITESDHAVRRLRELARDDSIQSILIRVDSPGGSVAPTQEVFTAARFAAESKPVVVSIGTVAASGGLWIALAGDRIFASPGSITGSIGVITFGFDLRGLADKFDVHPRVFKSGVQKDSGNPLRPVSPQEEMANMELISDVYDQFVTTVSERRKLPIEVVRTFADGRVMSGRVARDLGLIDEMGGLYEAAREAAWLAQSRQPDAPARDKASEQDPTLVYAKPEAAGLLRTLTGGASAAFSSALLETLRNVVAESAATKVEVR